MTPVIPKKPMRYNGVGEGRGRGEGGEERQKRAGRKGGAAYGLILATVAIRHDYVAQPVVSCL